MNPSQHNFYWLPEVISKVMRDNNIHNPAQLAKELAKVSKVSRATVYRHFGDDWTGTATFPLMLAISHRFKVPHTLLAGPRTHKTRG